MPSKPKYSLHKSTGQARVIIDRRHHSLGAFGSPESKERYDELVEAWLSKQDIDDITLTVDELVILSVNHAKEYYGTRGSNTMTDRS